MDYIWAHGWVQDADVKLTFLRLRRRISFLKNKINVTFRNMIVIFPFIWRMSLTSRILHSSMSSNIIHYTSRSRGFIFLNLAGANAHFPRGWENNHCSYGAHMWGSQVWTLYIWSSELDDLAQVISHASATGNHTPMRWRVWRTFQPHLWEVLGSS